VGPAQPLMNCLLGFIHLARPARDVFKDAAVSSLPLTPSWADFYLYLNMISAEVGEADGEEILTSITELIHINVSPIFVRVSLKCTVIPVFGAFALTWPPGTFIFIQMLTRHDVMPHVCFVILTTSLSTCHQLVKFKHLLVNLTSVTSVGL